MRVKAEDRVYEPASACALQLYPRFAFQHCSIELCVIELCPYVALCMVNVAAVQLVKSCGQ